MLSLTLPSGFCPAFALWSCWMYNIWKMRHGRAKGPTNVRALNCPCWRRDGRIHRCRQLGAWGPYGNYILPKPDINICLARNDGLWSCPAIMWVNGVLLGGLVKRRVTCFYHLLGVVASVGEAKGAPSCCGLAARTLRCFWQRHFRKWGACHSGLYQWRSICSKGDRRCWSPTMPGLRSWVPWQGGILRVTLTLPLG